MRGRRISGSCRSKFKAELQSEGEAMVRRFGSGYQHRMGELELPGAPGGGPVGASSDPRDTF